MIPSATGDDRLDTLCTQDVAGRLAVLSEIRGVGWRCVDDKRHTVSVHDENVLFLQCPAVDKTWASRFAATERADHDAIDDRQFGFKDAGLPEQRQKDHVEIVPNFGFVPSSKSSVDGAARTREFEEHVFPTTSAHHRRPQASDRCAVLTRGLPLASPIGSSAGSRGSNSAKTHPVSERLPPWLATWITQGMEGSVTSQMPNEVVSGASGHVKTLGQTGDGSPPLFTGVSCQL